MPDAPAAVMAGGDDTIVALATPPGRGAVALVRLSGARAVDIARALGAYDEGQPEPRHALRAILHDPTTREPLDEVLVTWFAPPRSYTGELTVEITTHGGTVAPQRVQAACVSAGARPALPGEFTRRAVLNGRLDLLQAEAVADIIDARTSAMQQQALAQLDGGLSRRLLALREAVVHLEALIAYDIDFPEEDDGPIAASRITAAGDALVSSLDALLRTAPTGALVRDGALVVLAGPPNAGKSSLFNALLGQSRAIVTPIAGTTRDAIEALLDRTPWPLRLVDTAGLRDTTDPIEQLGIEVSRRYLSEAQVVLACGDDTDSVTQTAAALAPYTTAPVIAVHTKWDLVRSETTGVNVHRVSAESGEGLVSLLQAIDVALGSSAVSPASGDVVITRERHRAGLTMARDEVRAFLDAWTRGALPAPVAAVHLFTAREALSDLIGTIDTDDVLDRVFRDFCIGK
ncbi:MAG TPA: tRNA uridine-5-carboxymethylaminomethyl(34) synthesis GTPase MnmE [Gemmatimonas sp.]|uniref:tRNA uridine-5-carboxymethylaminomethyl(34) synthesis GTPase MnmE n=1 Tax=Gemmatimonas sp. TaxID=1962908 RepID=UPI002ED78008